MIFDIYMIIFLFIYGLVMGSFLTVVATRIPKKESIVKPRSHCTSCNHILEWYELIPVVSFVIQKGRCRACKKKLSIIYPVIEILCGFLYSLSYILYGFGYEMVVFIIISSILITIFVSDFEYYIILDEPLIIGSILILFLKLYYFGFRTFIISLISGLLMFIFIMIIKLIGDKIFKQESIGGGDIKLITMFGFIFAVRLSLVTLVFSSFLAFPYALFCSITKTNREIPFGPFLITALMFVFIFMEPIKSVLNLFVFG